MLYASPAPETDRERLIRENDLVVVVEGFNAAVAQRIRIGETFVSRHGRFPHAAFVGVAFGTKIRASDGRGFVHVCAPTPELWTKVLAHRTQILYAPDIALVSAEMELRPGSTVLESGTWSGSLTHALARCVAPTGKVWTFEFNETRVKAAEEEFRANGIDEVTTVTHRDIERDGFPEELASTADAVFLDLPGPQKCVASVARSLRPNGVLCTFSPCIEQVHKTIVEMKKHGFADIKTVELLGRHYDVEGRCLQTDLSAPLSKETKGGWRKDQKRPRDGATEDSASTLTETVVAHPQQRLQSHTAYLTFARLIPAPENWTETLAERAKTSESGNEEVLKRAAEFLAKRRGTKKRYRPQSDAPKQPSKHVISNPDDYSD